MGVTCPVCQVTFCRANNFNRHFKEQHCEKLNEETETYQCLDCEAQFKRKEHVRNHINSVHKIGVELKCSSCSFTTLNKHSLVRHISHVHHNQYPEREEIKIEKSLKRDIIYFSCSYCSKKFRQKHALMIHLRTKHNCNTPSFNVKKGCPLCSFETVSPVSKGFDVMYNHFLSKHGLTMNIETFDFKNMSEFEIWKNDLENETASKFIRSNRHAKNHVRFTCHRSGNFQSKGSGKRNLKKKGSCKINGFCPASIVADLLNDGKVQVNYLSTHVGHTNDLKHILLSSDERKEIANKIVKNFSCEQILGEIRGNITSCDMKRIHLTTRKDILNIKKSMLVENVKKDSGKVVDDSWTVGDGCEVNNTEVTASSNQNILSVGGLMETINRHFNADAPYIMWSNEVSSTANKPSDEVMVCSPDNPDPIVICLENPSEDLVQTPNFESNKEDFVTKLTDVLREKITTFEELQAIQEHCKPISLILDSIKAMENTSIATIPVPQPQQITFTVTDGKGYVSTIRTNTTGCSHIVDVDSVTTNEKDVLAIQLV